jgi:hypothetical protein
VKIAVIASHPPIQGRAIADPNSAAQSIEAAKTMVSLDVV